MEQIYPLHEEYINKFCGMPVCIVTKEGQRHVGILTSCKSGCLTLNGGFDQAAGASVSPGSEGETSDIAGKSVKKKSKSKKGSIAKAGEKAETKSYYPYYPYSYYPFAEAFVIDLALIAFLFLLL